MGERFPPNFSRDLWDGDESPAAHPLPFCPTSFILLQDTVLFFCFFFCFFSFLFLKYKLDLCVVSQQKTTTTTEEKKPKRGKIRKKRKKKKKLPLKRFFPPPTMNSAHHTGPQQVYNAIWQSLLMHKKQYTINRYCSYFCQTTCRNFSVYLQGFPRRPRVTFQTSARRFASLFCLFLKTVFVFLSFAHF